MKVSANGKQYSFEIDEFRRHCLLSGLDNIGLTLQHADKISAYEEKIPSLPKITKPCNKKASFKVRKGWTNTSLFI
eukprot:UN01966